MHTAGRLELVYQPVAVFVQLELAIRPVSSQYVAADTDGSQVKS